MSMRWRRSVGCVDGCGPKRSPTTGGVYRRPILVSGRTSRARIARASESTEPVPPDPIPVQCPARDYTVSAQTRIERDGPMWGRGAAESIQRKGDVHRRLEKDRNSGARRSPSSGRRRQGCAGLPRPAFACVYARRRPKRRSLLIPFGKTVPAAPTAAGTARRPSPRRFRQHAFDYEKYLAASATAGVSADLDPSGRRFPAQWAAPPTTAATANGRISIAERSAPDGRQLALHRRMSRMIAGARGFTELEGVDRRPADRRFPATPTPGPHSRGLPAGVARGPCEGDLGGGELTSIPGRARRGGRGLLGAGWAPRQGEPAPPDQGRADDDPVARLRRGRVRLEGSEAAAAGDLAFRGEAACPTAT